MRIKIVIYGLVMVTIIAITSAIYSYLKNPPVITKTEYIEMPVEKIVTKIKRVEVPVEKIVTYEKEKIVKELKLPIWIESDIDKQIIANAEIPPYKGKTSTVAVLDTKTGEGQIIAKQKPLPFISFEDEKEIGIRYGFSTAGQAVDIFGRWTFLRVGSIHSAIYIEIDNKTLQPPEGKIMFEASYRW